MTSRRDYPPHVRETWKAWFKAQVANLIDSSLVFGCHFNELPNQNLDSIPLFFDALIANQSESF